MVQNVSTAVMQRRVEAHDSLDDFPTPSWAARAMVENIILPIEIDLGRMHVWEPAANRGYMVRAFHPYFGRVSHTDIFDYGVGYAQQDFLFDPPILADWIITNPPFRLAEQFVMRSFTVPSWRGTAIIVRSAFLEGADRYNNLFSVRPPSIVAQHVERVIMTKGIVRDPAKEYWDEATGKMKRPSTATSYCWLIWLRDNPWNCTRMMWIPPCRKAMERPGDYPSITGESNGDC